LSETREILLGVRPRLEKNYSVKISDDAINTALEMAPKYIRNLHLPDKASAGSTLQRSKWKSMSRKPWS
jgi:ATP-dependent Clp protease ATP-binding subunit ClpA